MADKCFSLHLWEILVDSWRWVVFPVSKVTGPLKKVQGWSKKMKSRCFYFWSFSIYSFILPVVFLKITIGGWKEKGVWTLLRVNTSSIQTYQINLNMHLNFHQITFIGILTWLIINQYVHILNMNKNQQGGRFSLKKINIQLTAFRVCETKIFGNKIHIP